MIIYLYLAEQPGVVDVSTRYGSHVSQSVLQTWERTNGLTLTDELKEFYTSHNGVYLTWKYNYNS